MATFREGGRVTIAGEEFVVPKANLATARAVAEVQRAAATDPATDGFLASAQVLQLLLVRAKPDLTVDQVLALVDVDELQDLLGKVQELAGFVTRGSQGEAARP